MALWSTRRVTVRSERFPLAASFSLKTHTAKAISRVILQNRNSFSGFPCQMVWMNR